MTRPSSHQRWPRTERFCSDKLRLLSFMAIVSLMDFALAILNLCMLYKVVLIITLWSLFHPDVPMCMSVSPLLDRDRCCL